MSVERKPLLHRFGEAYIAWIFGGFVSVVVMSLVVGLARIFGLNSDETAVLALVTLGGTAACGIVYLALSYRRQRSRSN